MTQKDVAEQLGVTKQAVSGYETGRVQATTEIQHLFTTRGINPTWLLTGDGEMLLAGQNDGGEGKPPKPAASSVPDLAQRLRANVPTEDDAFVLTVYHSIRPAAGTPDRFLVEGDEDDADRHLHSKRIFQELLGFWPPDDMRGTYIEGWSMKRENGGLDNGQLVLYRPVHAIDSGRRYLLTVVDLDTGDISPLCKRLQLFVGGGLKIISDNPGAGVEDEVLLPNGNDELVNQRTGRHVKIRIAGLVVWPRESDDEREVRTVTRTIEQLAARGLLNP